MRRGLKLLIAAGAVAVVAASIAVAYVRRIAPPWPDTEGQPYELTAAPDGCPVPPAIQSFVDAPGQFVPPGPVEVLLCTIPTGEQPLSVEPPVPPRQRVLRTGAADFAAALNRLPDRNQAWREWQRKHSGWWPDPPAETACGLAPAYEFSYALTYADRSRVLVVETCGGFTTGARTRMDDRSPFVLDVFLRYYDAQR